MTPQDNDETGGNTPATAAQLLTEISQVVADTGDLISYGYSLPNKTAAQTRVLDESQATLERFTRRLGESRSQLLAKTTELVQEDIDFVREAKRKLDATVRKINDINELVHIATQVAAIAAGMMV